MLRAQDFEKLPESQWAQSEDPHLRGSHPYTKNSEAAASTYQAWAVPTAVNKTECRRVTTRIAAAACIGEARGINNQQAST
eukprot:612854-Amphidinium_carterae.1